MSAITPAETTTTNMEGLEDDPGSDEDFIPDKEDASTSDDDEEEGEYEATIEQEEINKYEGQTEDEDVMEGVDVDPDRDGDSKDRLEGQEEDQPATEGGDDEDYLIEDEEVVKKPVGAQKRKRKYTRRAANVNKKVPKVVIKKTKPPPKPKGKHSSLEERQMVIDLMLSGKTIADVARELGRSRQYVNFWWSRRGEDTLVDKPRPGRPQGPRAPGKGQFPFEATTDEGAPQDLTTHARVLDEDDPEAKDGDGEGEGDEEPAGDAKWYKCVKCNVTYTWMDTEDMEPQADDEQYKCPQCDEQLEKQSEPPKGTKKRGRLPSDEPRIYTCTFCQKQFKAKSHLKAHERSHTGEKPFKCQYCEKGFAQQAGVKAHEKIHTGEKPFKCEQCNKAFTEKGTLKRHLWMHTGEKPYMCQYCGKKFTSSGNLNAHTRTHTGQLSVDGETTQPGGQSFYRCKYCGKTFVWPWHLKRHESIHSGDKPHMCQYCGKKFSRRDGLREHERVHTGEKPYECQYCEKAFATATPLRVHERVHIRRGDFQLRAQQKVSSDSASVATTSSIAGTTAGTASSGASGAAASSNQQEFKDPGLATFLQSIMGHHSSRHGFQGDSSGYAANMAHMAHMQPPQMQQPALQDMSQAISPTMNPMQSHIASASPNQQQQQQHLPNLAQQQQQNVAAQLQNVPFDSLHNSVGHTTQSHNASVGASHHPSMPSVYSTHAAMPSTLQPDYEIKCEPTIPSQSSNGMISPIAHHNDGRVTASSYQTQGQLVHQREQYLNNQPIDLITEHKTEMGNSLKDHVIEMNNTLSLQQSQHQLQSEHFPEDAGIQDMHHQRQHQNDHLLSEHSVRDHDQGNAPPQMEQLSHGHGHTAIATDHTTQKSDHLTEQDDPMVHQSDHISGEHSHITQQRDPITEKRDSIITEKREDIIEQSVPVSGKTDSIIGNSDATLDNDLMDVPLHSDSDDDTDQTKADGAMGEDLQTNKDIVDNERNVSPVKAEIVDPVKTTLMQSIGLHKSGTAPQVKVKSGKSKIIHQKPPTKIKSQTTTVEKPNKRKKGGKIRLLIRLPKPPAVKESLLPSNDETGGGDDMDTVQENPVVVKGKTKTVKMLKTKNKTVRNLKTTKGAMKKGLSSEGPLTKRGRGRPRVNQTNEQRKTSLQKGRKGFATKGGIIRKKKLTGLIKARKERKLRAIKNFQCSYCPMMFKGSGQLKIHERVHTGEKPFKCHFCDKTFAQAAGHKAHERIHTGERPYQCNRCEKSFREKGSLKIHQRTHTGEKPFMCSSCGRRFTNSGNLRTHERVHGLIIGEDGMHIQENLYACNSCDKKFQWPWHLKRHQAIHSGDKPHVCPFCGKAYARRDHLREHERSHTGEKPYACKHCEKSFAVACSLRAHEKTHLLEGSNPEAYKERMQRRRRSRLSKQPPPQGIHTQVQAYYDSWRKDLLDLTGRNPDEDSERAGAEQESSSVHSRAELGESSTTDLRSDDGMVRDLEDRSLESRHLESEQLDDRHLDDRRIESRDIVARSMEESMDKQELVARMEIRRHLEARELLESRDHEGRHVDARHLEARELEEQELNAREIEAHQIEARQIEARQIEAQIEARQIEARQIEARQIEARQIEARQIEAQIEARQIETRQIEARHLEAMEGRLSADSNTGRPAMMEGSTARAWGHEYQVSTIDPRLHMQAYEYPPPMHIGHPWPQAHKHSQ